MFQARAGTHKALPTDTELYVRGLELIVNGSTTDGTAALRELVDNYPDSPYAARASALLARFASQLDQGGIVFFYIANLLTSVSVAEAVPIYLGSSDTLVLGLGGLAAVGVGIGGSYLLSRDRDLSFGQELWMETAQVFTVVNYSALYDLAAPPGNSDWMRFKGLGAALTAVAARAAAFALVRDGSLPPGKPAFVLLNYVLAWAYTTAFLNGVLKSTDPVLTNAATVAVPTAAAAASFLLWNSARWPDYRTGLTVLGAIGGGLTGVFADLILVRLVPGIDSRNLFGMAIGTALAGQILTALLTDGVPREPARVRPLAFQPVIDSRGSMGLAITFSY